MYNKIKFGSVVHVFVKMENIQQVLWMITYDEIIEADFPTILMKTRQSNAKFLYFTCFFMNYYSIIDSCFYYHLIKYRPNTNNELKQVLH